MDFVETWPSRQTWTEIANPDIYGSVSQYAGNPARLQIGIAMLPEDGSGNLATCATGAYNSYYKSVGSKLVSLGRGNADVRLGWEANGTWYKWSIGGDPTNWKNCFRQEALAIKSTAPGVSIDFDMNKSGSSSVYAAYPGDDVVDVIGVDWYDMYPAYHTQADWDNGYMTTSTNGPIGIGAWLAFARQHGKRLSVPEWGINNGSGGGADDPIYIQNMFNFFKNNASSIAYECYFNLQSSSFMIDPPGSNPNSSAMYQQLF